MRGHSFPRERIVFALFGLVFALIAYYTFLINQTIFNAVEESKLQASIGELQKDTSELELAFIENENSLNLDFAYAKGFHDVENRHFVTRNTNLTIR